MTSRISLKTLLLFVCLAFYGIVLQAQDYTATSGDNLVSLTAVPAYDPNSHLLTSVVVTLSDYTVGAAAVPPNLQPYVYPAPNFTFPFAPPAANSPAQKVTPVAGSSTVSGSMDFRPLKSSSTSTFLYVDLYYGVDTIQTRHWMGSTLEIPLSNSQ
jgi:hypothetical protein